MDIFLYASGFNCPLGNSGVGLKNINMLIDVIDSIEMRKKTDLID